MTRNRLGITLPFLALGLVTIACGSSSGDGTAADGGPTSSNPTAPGSSTTLSCLVQLKGFEPQCQFYEASGADAIRTIDQLRAECIDQASATAKVLDRCPTEKGLGGCKTPIVVKGADATLFITNFEFEPVGDAGILSHKTAAQVKSFCASQGKDATYVPAG